MPDLKCGHNGFSGRGAICSNCKTCIYCDIGHVINSFNVECHNKKSCKK